MLNNWGVTMGNIMQNQTDTGPSVHAQIARNLSATRETLNGLTRVKVMSDPDALKNALVGLADIMIMLNGRVEALTPYADEGGSA